MDTNLEKRLVDAFRDTWSACAPDLMACSGLREDSEPEEILDAIADLLEIHGMERVERPVLMEAFRSLSDVDRVRLAKQAFGGG